MYCQYCGREIPDGAAYCPDCGSKVGLAPSTYASPYPVYNRMPKEPSTLGPFLLGMFLGLIGVIVAVLVYNGNDGPYTKNPTTHALVWSILGILVWIPIMIILLSLMSIGSSV